MPRATDTHSPSHRIVWCGASAVLPVVPPVSLPLRTMDHMMGLCRGAMGAERRQTADSTRRRRCRASSHQPICRIRVKMRALDASIRWGVRVRGAGSTAARRAARSRVRTAADVW
jgi:hypothetical protein